MQIIPSIQNETTPARDTKDIRAIILHHTGSSGSDEANLKYLNQPDYISTHYLVATTGKIYQCVDDDHTAYHAGVSEWAGLATKGESLNWCTLGIEVNSDGVNFTDEQRQAVKELLLFLMGKYSIGADNVLRHKDIAPKRKTDIGDNFWKDKFVSYHDYQIMLNQELAKPEVSDWAVPAVHAAIEKKIATDWTNPQEIVATPVLEQMLFNAGVIKANTGKGLTKERAAVVFQTLKLI